MLVANRIFIVGFRLAELLLIPTIQPEHDNMKKTFLFIFSLSLLVSFIDGESLDVDEQR